jgi:NADPH-dependent 2,4-dienoyl-CoA reductase/sulfur reductase-like enzyme
MSAHFDVVVVGAGPGGIAAATLAAEAQRRVCLIDDNPSPGGQIWRGFLRETASNLPHGRSFSEWGARLERSGSEVAQGWQAVDHPGPGVLRLERAGECRDVRFAKLIVATGARERFLPFPGWTLPGVMGAGGAQALVKGGLDAGGKRIVVAGSGPLLLAAASALQSAGADILGIYEQAPLSRVAAFGLSLFEQPAKLAEGVGYRLKTLRAPFRAGSWVVRADGKNHIETVTLTNGRKQWTVACDWLACGFHLVPNLELPRLLGCNMANGFVQVDHLLQSSVPGVYCIGELTGIGGLEKALVEGQIAGFAAVGRDAEALRLLPQRSRLKKFAKRLDHTFALRPELRTLANAGTLICRCEDVPTSALESCTSWREAKLHTRCGMGACQGRICGAATEFLFGWEAANGRPPIFPAAVSTIAAEIHEPVSH